MSVREHHDAAAFLERAEAWLLERQAEHNRRIGFEPIGTFAHIHF